MSKHTLTGFITWRAPRSWEKEPEVDFLTYDPRTISTGSERIVVAEHSIEVEVPDDFDPRPEQIAKLKAQRDKARADFAVRIAELDAQINNLLAIEA